jgi:hypothetical protein
MVQNKAATGFGAPLLIMQCIPNRRGQRMLSCLCKWALKRDLPTALLQGLHQPLAIGLVVAGSNATASLLDGAGEAVWTSEVQGLPKDGPAQGAFLEVGAALLAFLDAH